MQPDNVVGNAETGEPSYRCREQGAAPMTERIGAGAVAAITGLAERTVTKMAAAGEIPGAARFGRRWTFNERSVRLWVQEREREIAWPLMRAAAS